MQMLHGGHWLVNCRRNQLFLSLFAVQVRTLRKNMANRCRKDLNLQKKQIGEYVKNFRCFTNCFWEDRMFMP